MPITFSAHGRQAIAYTCLSSDQGQQGRYSSLIHRHAPPKQGFDSFVIQAAYDPLHRPLSPQIYYITKG